MKRLLLSTATLFVVSGLVVLTGSYVMAQNKVVVVPLIDSAEVNLINRFCKIRYF